MNQMYKDVLKYVVIGGLFSIIIMSCILTFDLVYIRAVEYRAHRNAVHIVMELEKHLHEKV